MFDGSHLRVYEFTLAHRTVWKGAGVRVGREVSLETTSVVCEGKDGGLDEGLISCLSTVLPALYSSHGFTQLSSLGTCRNSYL